ncbi:hypothetical protein [Paraburkholderia caledonica]|uniref:hypothetical protein n=1 Tax=Paraburkholderia caledonica TaxID=134536 RepID=UPI0013E0B82D|nr:hypothetical protein [Paraburkholderia caledonica]
MCASCSKAKPASLIASTVGVTDNLRLGKKPTCAWPRGRWFHRSANSESGERRSAANIPITAIATISMAPDVLHQRKIGEPFSKHATVEEATSEVLKSLTFLFHVVCPSDESSFHDQILIPVLGALQQADHPEPLNINLRTHSPQFEFTHEAYMPSMVKSCAYALLATVAEESGNADDARSHIGNAQYFLGLLEGLVLVEPVLAHANTERGKSGATKRDAKFEPLRDLARKLAGKKSYPSKRNAALSIKDEVLAAAKDHEISLSEMQAERTITGWLDGMLFGSKP